MSKLWTEKIVTVKDVAYQDIEPSWGNGADDCTSDILSLDKYGLKVLQFTHVRRLLQIAIVTKLLGDFNNWGTHLTSDERSIAIKWIVAPYVLRVPAIPDEDDQANWFIMVKNLRGVSNSTSLQGREYIIELMRERASDELRREIWTYNEANQFFYDTDSHIRAYNFANTSDLIDWISNKVGSSFENDGFAQTTYFSSTLKDDLISIYNGYY